MGASRRCAVEAQRCTAGSPWSDADRYAALEEEQRLTEIAADHQRQARADAECDGYARSLGCTTELALALES